MSSSLVLGLDPGVDEGVEHVCQQDDKAEQESQEERCAHDDGDVLLADGRVIYTDVRFKETTSYKRIRPGTYEFFFAETNLAPIPSHADIETLDTSVKDYEPHLALDGGEDGLDFYRSISEKWKEALAPGGRLYFEVGIGQADNVLRIMRTQGFGDIQVVKDHHDIPRVVFGTLCTEL